jgi:hypothetical protein
LIKDSIINLSLGILFNSLSVRIILKARKTEKDPAAGRIEIEMMAKSKTFQGF